MRKKDVNVSSDGTQAKVDYAILNDATLTKEQVKEGLTKDIESVAVFISNLLRSKECLDALTETMWNRYQKYHEERKRNPGLFEGKEVSNVR